MADATYQPKVYRKQGGDELVVASGGKINVESGGTIEVNGTDLIDELAALNGLDATELGYLNGVTAGTAASSKALVLSAGGDIQTITSGTITTLTSTTVNATTVDAPTVTNASLVLESLNPLTVKLNDTNALQVDNAGISGFAAAADAAGTGVYIETQDGGADSAVDGGNSGGLFSLKAGDAAAGGADMSGAPGGAVTVATGAGSAGGAHTANNPTGGNGGTLTIQSGAGGAGGAGGSGAGGNGGSLIVSTGAGGASGAGGTGASGAGGAISVTASAGGTAAADTPGGAGGGVSVTAGAGAAGGAHTANNPSGGDGGDITLTVGAGGAAGGGTGVAGDPGKVQVVGGLFHFAAAQVIDMADASVTLTLNPGTPAGTLMTSNFLRVDANSGATENLLLPPEADCAGVMLVIQNTGGESIVVQNDAAATVDTVATAEFGLFFCDGTDWFGMNKA